MAAIMTFPLLCVTLVTLLMLMMTSIDASVIKRREIASTLQEHQQQADNQTRSQTTLLTHQNLTESTRLLPPPPENGISRKTTLKLINDATTHSNVADDDGDRLLLLPSTTSAIPNTIIDAQEQQQSVKEKTKLSKVPLTFATTEQTLSKQQNNNDGGVETGVIEQSSTKTVATLLEPKSSRLEDSTMSKATLRVNKDELKFNEKSPAPTTESLLHVNEGEATLQPSNTFIEEQSLLEHQGISTPTATPTKVDVKIDDISTTTSTERKAAALIQDPSISQLNKYEFETAEKSTPTTAEPLLHQNSALIQDPSSLSSQKILSTSTQSPTTAEPQFLDNKSSPLLSLGGDSNEIQVSSSSATSSTSSASSSPKAPKQPKFLNDNSTNFNQLNLPNTADVWTLAGMKAGGVSMANDSTVAAAAADDDDDADGSQMIPSKKEKTLTDWTQILKMGVDKNIENTLTEDKAPSTASTLTTPPASSITSIIVNASDDIKSNYPNAMNDTLPQPASNQTHQQTLSAVNDNVHTTIMEEASLKSNEEINNKNEEKFFFQNEKPKESESTAIINAHKESNATTETTMTTTTMKMITTMISTPATALVSTSTEKTLNESSSLANLSFVKSEKSAVLGEEIEAIDGNQTSSVIPTTIKPIETITTTTVSHHRPSVNQINLSELTKTTTTTTTASPQSPDIHQISTKSNLETPTTTTTTAKSEETIETTPTITVQRVNSSAIQTNQTDERRRKAEDDVTTDSLSNENIDIKAQKTNESTAVVTKDTNIVIHEEQQSSTLTPLTSSTTKSVVSIDELSQQIATTTDEPLNSFEHSTVNIATTTSEMNKTLGSNSSTELSTEATLTNFIDDSTTTATSASTISLPPPPTTTTIATPASITPINSTIEVSSVESSTSTSTTTTTTEPTLISIETTAPLTTDSAISSDATTTTTTSTSTETELPIIIPTKATETTTTETTTSSSSSPSTTEKTVEMLPPITTHITDESGGAPISTTLSPELTYPDIDMSILRAQPPSLTKSTTPDSQETDVNVVIAISVSVIGVVALILLVAFLYLMRKRAKATSYGQRCRPVSLDAYSLDNVSVLGSVRRKSALRASAKRSYGNAAFDDPSLRHNVLQSAAELAKFVERRSNIFEEFRDVPQIIARPDEIPAGCENKNRYANVIPLPETRVILQRREDDDTTEYINANYVRGPKDAPNYYIACQAPLESTVQDFWRMIWEQQSRVIIQATDLIENGVEKCAEYLPPSVTLDNHTTFGDFQITLKNREVKDKYAISTIMLKNTVSNTSREITHYWYKWPEIGVPAEEAPIIAMLLEARSSLKSYAVEVTNELKEKSNSSLDVGGLESGGDGANGANGAAGSSSREINGNISDKSKNILRNQGPLTIHCSPGTGRTGTIIACDLAIRSLETTKSLDIPQIVYYIRRGRASAIQTKEQYEFIYKVANVYAMKITNVPSDN